VELLRFQHSFVVEIGRDANPGKEVIRMEKHIFRVPVDTAHFKDTIEVGKPYTEILPFLPAEEQLQAIADNGMVRYWGSLPGESNKRTFKLLNAGDELLCYRSGKYVALATIAFSLINPSLARYSWGETKQKTTWELMYFFREVRLISVDISYINEAFGYKNAPVMGFSVLSGEKASKFLETHGSVSNFLQSLLVAR
jgi:hypothetical protein